MPSLLFLSQDKLDKSIADTERYIAIENQVLKGSRAIVAAHRRNNDSSVSARQPQISVEMSEARLAFLQTQLDKKRRRKAGMAVEEPRRFNQLGEYSSGPVFVMSKARFITYATTTACL